jgi:hypothetical protein
LYELVILYKTRLVPDQDIRNKCSARIGSLHPFHLCARRPLVSSPAKWCAAAATAGAAPTEAVPEGRPLTEGTTPAPGEETAAPSTSAMACTGECCLLVPHILRDDDHLLPSAFVLLAAHADPSARVL